MRSDHLADEDSTKRFGGWLKYLMRNEPERLAAEMAIRHRRHRIVAVKPLAHGAYNFCWRVRFEDDFLTVVRFVALGQIRFRQEKVEGEVAVIEYLARHTSIPVPEVLGMGRCRIGPYTVMNYIRGSPMSEFLKDPLHDAFERLNPKVSTPHLKLAYRAMAKITLELYKQSFPRIGSLRKRGSGESCAVTDRPFTKNENDLLEAANLPHDLVLSGPLDDAAEYFEALASQQLHNLETQRNDAFRDEADCRKKYIARCLLRKIARQTSTDYRHGPFPLFCDDFRPSNVLIDPNTLAVTGVLDWDFTYAAPAEFSHAAPWWLLLENPEDWEVDLKEFLERYEPRLRLFLEAMRECEVSGLREGTLLPSQCLADRMEQSMEDGLFWICIALRHFTMLDEIYWVFLDEKFFGTFTSVEERLKLLSQEEQDNIDGFVRDKIQQATEGTLTIRHDFHELLAL